MCPKARLLGLFQHLHKLVGLRLLVLELALVRLRFNRFVVFGTLIRDDQRSALIRKGCLAWWWWW